MTRAKVCATGITSIVLFLTCIFSSPTWAREPDRPCAKLSDSPRVHPRPDAHQEHFLHQLRSLATGKGVSVAVVDTGVSQHEQLQNLHGLKDLVSPDAEQPLKDCDAHGTIVAGLIAGHEIGLAPDATIYSIRQTSAHYDKPAPHGDEEVKARVRASGSLASLTEAISTAVDAQVDVINISVVSCVPPTIASKVDTRALERALNRAEAANIPVVAAAGNQGSHCQPGWVVFPAHSPTVIATSALASPHAIADYSIPHPRPPLAADGLVPVALSTHKSRWADGTLNEQGKRVDFEGTSFAAPRITGLIALLKERNPALTAPEIRELLYSSAQPITGYIDPLHLLQSATPDTTPAKHQLHISPVNEAEEDFTIQRAQIALSILAGCGVISLATSEMATRRRKARR